MSNCDWDYPLLRKDADRGGNYPLIEVNQTREKKFNQENSLFKFSTDRIYNTFKCYLTKEIQRNL